MLADLKYALRQLRKTPGFTLTAVLTLAIGIGGVTAVFSVVEAVLLRPLPYKDSAKLFALHERVEHLMDGDANLSAPDVLTFERESKAFTGVGGFVGASYEASGAGAPFQARVERLTASMFPVLGIDPVLGRTFTQQEDDNSAPVTVISYALWQERFQLDPQVLGKTIELDRRPYTIIGVMPREFESPAGLGALAPRDLWVPMSFTPVEKGAEADNFDYGAVARLKPGVTQAQAQQDVDRVIAVIQAKLPDIRLHASMHALKEDTVRDARPLLRMLMVSVGLILLIACVNLANLLLVRAAGRRREFGVRLALGAARRAMLQQLLTESLLLSAIGGLVGVALAVVLVHIAAVNLPDSLPRLNEIAVRWPVVFLAIALTGMTGVVCGLAPALASMKAEVLDALREGTQGAGQSRGQHRLRNGLVMTETALAMVLLVGAGLLLRSFQKMLATDAGVETTHVMTASLALPKHDYPTQERVNAFYSELQKRLEAMPGVRTVGFSSNIPVVGRNSSRLFAPQGYVKKPNEGWSLASNYLVQGNYFDALHIPLIRGRYFDARDERPGAPLAAIISQSFAEHYFAGKDAVGMHLKVGPSYDNPMPPIEVVGVVGDVKPNHVDEAQMVQMYEPVSQGAADLGPLAAMIGVVGELRVVVRTADDPSALEAGFTKAVRQLDPLLAITDMQTMDEVVAATESSRRFNTMILTAFAGIALLLSLLGIYGVLAYAVTERKREIAIRMALGATREDVLRRTIRSALLLAGVGVAVGLVASVGLTHLLESLLYGVKPLDGPAIAGAVVVLLACSVLAGWLPARRAASIEPMDALRSE
ncbi:MAG TPA: ABC transporter permease [Silvibacterium sp.]|nr:ABC transporter permease [Silvibacterium sp.]